MVNWRSALAFLTIIPVNSGELDFSSFYLFPIIEGSLGLVSMVYFAKPLGLPSLLAAVLSLGTVELLEGFNHLDGLIDVGDAWMVRARKDPKKLLEVMRDKYTGTGLLAFLVFTLMITVASLSYEPSGALAMASAAASVGMLEAARMGTSLNDGGLGDQFLKAVKSRKSSLLLALLLAAVPSIPAFLQTPAGAIAFLISPVVFLVTAAYFNRCFKFTNGDVLGANFEIDRAISLLILLLLMHF